MNVVGKVGSLISQGVYSVATPFHPFGGAVDVIVVEQQDGTYRSTPWYVRFGKFQGVLKGAEKFVRISVNGVEAGFHMYLDNSGEAYFVREIVPSNKDSEKDGEVKKTENLEDTRQDSSNINNDVSNSGNDSVDDSKNDDFNNAEVQFSDEHVSFSTTQIENDEADNERRIYDFQDQQSPNSVGSADYQNFHYGSLDQLEDVVESQSSDSEVVIISVDGHVLTAPISSSEQNMDNVQLSTPQFHLGPGEGAEFSASNEEFSNGQDTWASDYLSDFDVTGPNNSSTEGIITTLDNTTASAHLLEVREVEVELAKEALETHNMKSITSDSGKCNSSGHVSDSMGRREVFKSCLELQELSEPSTDEELQDMDSPSMEVEVKDNVEDSINYHPSSLPTMEENEAQDDTKSESSAKYSLPKPDSTCNELPVLRIEVHASEDNALTTDNTDVTVSDGVSGHSIDNNQEVKDEQFSLAPEASGLQNSLELESSKSEVLKPQAGSFDEGARADAGMGFEISLCGNLLHAGLGLDHAAETFDAHRISMEKFKASASSITKDENLVVRYKGMYLPWEKAAPIVLGMVAFGLDLAIESKDAIPVEQDEPVTPREDSPRLTSTPSGRRWRLWPIPFRRVKTLQHTTSNASSEDIFVDSESGSLNPHAETTPTSSGGTESPHKQLLRTNVPTTEQIASLNLKDGQNMITFSFSTRVLGTQQVDAHIYLWKWNARIVISDVDGTITRSDVLGQFMPLVGKDWTQSGVARLFSAIKENGYHLLFLSARAIVQAYLTRSFLLNLKQDGKALPSGPVVISPDGLFPSLYREVIRRAPHEFKIACLEDIKALFPSDYNPFYAGFGNRDTDELSYRKIGIPKGKIFIINPKGEVAISHRIDVKSYTSLHTLVNDMFPPTSLVEQEDYNSWNYWKMPLPNVD